METESLPTMEEIAYLDSLLSDREVIIRSLEREIQNGTNEIACSS